MYLSIFKNITKIGWVGWGGKSFFGFGGRALPIRDVCINFEPCLKAQNSVTIHLNINKLGKVTTVNATFLLIIFIFNLFQYDLTCNLTQSLVHPQSGQYF